MACEIHLNDIGTEFRVEVQDCNENALNISTATTKQLIFKKPDGVTLTKDADFVTTGSDGLIKYVSASGDLDALGTWKIQSYIDMPSGKWRSEFKTFKVHRNL